MIIFICYFIGHIKSMNKQNSKLQIRRSEDRGHNEISWLKSAHSFSFGSYNDPAHRGFQTLRVINEDWIRGGGGFAPHPHENMEILTYPLSGALQHRDSTGAEGVIVAGDIQLMSAGHGIVHSEFNASPKEEAHLLQIWVYPSQKGLPPRYQQESVKDSLEKKLWTRLLRPESSAWSLGESLIQAGAELGEDRSLEPRQSLEVWAKRNAPGESYQWNTDEERSYWLQMVKGELKISETKLKAGDAVALEKTKHVNLVSETESEFILFVF